MSIGTVKVSTDISIIIFKVLNIPTLFLLYLIDIDYLKVYFNNTIDKLIQGEIRVPVLRK